MNNTIYLCGLKIEKVYDYYFMINNKPVIMQPSRINELYELDGKKHLFKDFESFKVWIEN